MSKSSHFDAWNAGFVRRWHTNVRMNRHTDMNCSHSQRVAILLIKFWPNIRRSAIIHALSHDQGEIAFADVPYPVKRAHPEIRKAGQEIEDSYIENLGLKMSLKAMDKEKIAWCDLFDSYLWMLRCEPSLRKRPEWKAQLDQIIREAQEWGIADKVLDMHEAAHTFYVDE